MSNKRQRSRPRADGSAPETKEEATPAEEAAPGRPASPFPPLAESMVAGLRAVGARPAVLAAAFLSLLATWGFLAALGIEVPPRLLGVLQSVSPAHLFSDAPVALNVGGSVWSGVGALFGIAAVRAVTFGALLLLVLDSLAPDAAGPAAALRRLPGVAVRLLLLFVAEITIVIVALQLVTSFFGAQMATLVVAAALWGLSFATIVAVAEDAWPREALGRGFRAARLPGTRHLAFVMVYFVLLLYSSVVAPFRVHEPATPSIGTWAYALVATLIHAGVLAALAFRWLAVRERVPR